MLEIDQSTVDFLVTADMAREAEGLVSTTIPQLAATLAAHADRPIERVYFVACGSPLCSCRTGAMLLAEYSAVPVACYSGWDFLDATPAALGGTSLVVGVSDSGNTEEIARSLTLARERGALTIGITKDATGNLVCAAAEHVVAYGGACIWVAHTLLAYTIALAVIDAHGGHPQADAIKADLPKVPALLRRLVDQVEESSKQLALRATQWPFIYSVSGGNLLPLGYKGGIVTMLEFTWTHGSALNAAEFRHGPLEVTAPGVPYVFMIPTDDSRHTVQRCLEFVSKLTDDIIVFDSADLNTGLHPAFDPIALFVPLEFFYYYLALSKDHNPDDRRYYGGLIAY